MKASSMDHITSSWRCHLCPSPSQWHKHYDMCTYQLWHVYLCNVIHVHKHYGMCTYTGTCVHTLGHVYIQWDMCTYTGTCVHTLGHVYIHWDMCTYTGTCVHTLGHVYIHWDMCTYTETCIYTHKLTIVMNYIYSIYNVMQCLWWGLKIVWIFIIFSNLNEISIDNV